MSKDKLAIQYDQYRHKIGWYLAEEQEFGLMLGHETMALKDAPETVAATNAIIALPSVHPGHLRDSEWIWESETTAKQALRVAKAAIAAVNDAKPMPEWALKATAEGWKAPKGWKP